MIENHGHFVCQLIVGFTIAGFAWVVGLWMFVREGDKEKPATTKTDSFRKKLNFPQKSKIEVNKFEIGFLQDLIRWAEMLMEEVADARRVIERKALLMVSLSFALIGYSFSDISPLDKSWKGWAAIVYSSFGMVALLGLKVINFAGHWPRGQHPCAFYDKILSEIPTGKEQKWVMYYMLEIYGRHIDENMKVNEQKYKSIHAAKWFLILGMGGLLSMALDSSEHIVCICCWLANNVASQPSIFEVCPTYP